MLSAVKQYGDIFLIGQNETFFFFLDYPFYPSGIDVMVKSFMQEWRQVGFKKAAML